jgi:predicted Zn-dependent protease
VEASSEQDKKSTRKALLKQFKTAEEIGLFDEGDINFMGYSFLGELEKPEMAEVILWCNTILHPESANVYDSYGEVLATNGKMKESLTNYKKAVALASKNNDPQLELFKENLKKIEDKIKP